MSQFSQDWFTQRVELALFKRKNISVALKRYLAGLALYSLAMLLYT